MKRVLAVFATVATLLLASCGGSGDESATDPEPIAGGGASEPSETPKPSMIGDHPAYRHADYTYDLEVQCFCPYFGEPVTVTVAGGEVSDAVWATKGPGHAKGDPVADEWLRLGIDDILKEAADPSYDEVLVTWPAGADHPAKVAIDKMADAVDDEITYLITNVQPVHD